MNRGRYCPVYNPMGTYKDTGSKNWYETTFPITSTYSAFQNIGTAIGRPDGKSDKYIYSENFIDKRTNAEKANIPQLLNEVHNGAVNGSLGGYSDAVGMVNLKQQSNSGSSTNLTFFKEEYPTWKEDFIRNNPYVYHNGGFGKSVSVTEASSTMFFVTLNTSITRVLGADTFVVTKLPITSYKTSLTTDVIGNPANYPSMMIDRLASGKPILMKPMLIDEAGTSLIPSGQTTFQLSGSKAITMLSSIKSTDSDTAPTAPTWASTVPALDSINNKFTQTLATGDIAIVNVASSNAVANISTPKAVQQVGNYAVATNSNEITQGQNLIQLIGKVGISSISNRLEAVNLLNTIINTDGTFNTIPKNTAVVLNATVSPAIKTLSTIATADDGELLYQVFGEEIVGTGDTGSFSQLANGTKADWNGTTVRTVCAIIGTGVYE